MDSNSNNNSNNNNILFNVIYCKKDHKKKKTYLGTLLFTITITIITNTTIQNKDATLNIQKKEKDYHCTLIDSNSNKGISITTKQ